MLDIARGVRPGGANDAVGVGRHWAGKRRPSSPVAVVVADLTTLTGAAVDAALTTANENLGAFVPDLSGTGTIAVTAARPTELRTSFGPDSACRREQLCLKRLEGVDRRLRHDVEGAADLEAASGPGLGKHTLSAVHGLRHPRMRGLGT